MKTQTQTDAIAEIKSWLRTFAGAFLAYCALTTIAAAQYHIPSESMVPTLEVGDRVLVSKFAYGYSRHSLPLGLGALLPASDARLFGRLPDYGDVAVFTHPQDGKTMIKRIVGLPGDVIAVRDGDLIVNGARLELSAPAQMMRRADYGGLEAVHAAEETLPNGVRHPVHHFLVGNDLSQFGPYRVPEGYLFAMGDNRDNSLDSRWAGMGPIPIENLIGRAETVIFAPRDCRSDGPCRRRWLAPFQD